MTLNELRLRLTIFGLTPKEVRNFTRKLTDDLRWTAACDFAGYGTFGYRGKTWKAHRLVYAATHPDEDIDGVFVVPDCGDVKCCDPECLRSQEKRPMRCDPDNYQGKMHPQTVDQLRHLDWDSTNKVGIARQLGVSPSTVRKIMQGHSWKQHLSPATSGAGLNKSITKVSHSIATTSRRGATSGVHPWNAPISRTYGNISLTAAQMKRR